MTQQFETGQVYAIDHSRKGKFHIKVTGQDDEWLNGVIVEGMAKAMLSYNELYVGDDVTLRKSFIRSSSKQESAS